MAPLLRFSHINNLTEARFAAAAGAAWVGFCFDRNHPQYVNPLQAKDLKDWLAGPRFFGSFSGHDSDEVKGISEMLGLHGVEIHAEAASGISLPASCEVFCTATASQFMCNPAWLSLPATWVIRQVNLGSSQELLHLLAGRLWYYQRAEGETTIPQGLHPGGISLMGRPEDAPGLLDMEQVQTLLDGLIH